MITRTSAFATHHAKLASVRMLWLVVGCCSSPGFLAAQQTSAPDTIVGRDKCAACHTTELATWEASSHNQKAWSLLDHTKAPEFAAALGVSNVKGNSACTQCHGTHQSIGNQLKILPGNSCESCHGGAKDWMKMHYDFGAARVVDSSTPMASLLADRTNETAVHRAERDAACKTAGMIRSSDAYSLAKNCLACHLVPNEKLVTAGHPVSSDFEFVEWSSGEVRHNFLLDTSVNAEAPTNWMDPQRSGQTRSVTGRKRLNWLAGMLADLEMSLNARSRVTSVKRGTLGDKLNDRILDVQDELEDLDFDALKPVLAAVADINKKSLKEITANDAVLYTTAAQAVASVGQKLLEENSSGAKLPDSIKIRSKVKGTVFAGK